MKLEELKLNLEGEVYKMVTAQLKGLENGISFLDSDLSSSPILAEIHARFGRLELPDNFLTEANPSQGIRYLIARDKSRGYTFVYRSGNLNQSPNFYESELMMIKEQFRWMRREILAYFVDNVNECAGLMWRKM
nr:hypothetical protein [uncultured archaeon]AQS29146.1 hypothetical protein [uncultured archaeon]